MNSERMRDGDVSCLLSLVSCLDTLDSKFEPENGGYIDAILRFSISFIYKYI